MRGDRRRSALPIRGVLYTFTQSESALIAIQILDGVANAIFGVVSMLVIPDRTRGTGRFNLAQGGLAMMVGIGAELSNALGGQLVERFGYNASFLGLASIGALAFVVLWWAVPETRERGHHVESCGCRSAFEIRGRILIWQLPWSGSPREQAFR